MTKTESTVQEHLSTDGAEYSLEIKVALDRVLGFR